MAQQTSSAFNGFWMGVILLGFAGFLISLGGAIRYGFDSTGARRPPLKMWLAACFVCFSAWCFALSHFPVPLPTAETRERAALLSH